MFDFGNANEKQREAIQTTEGPLLLIAGPGTGKTFTLVQRAVYLILEKKVSPSEILIATFTEKAAKEFYDLGIGAILAAIFSILGAVAVVLDTFVVKE